MEKGFFMRVLSLILFLTASIVGQATETTFDFSSATDQGSVSSGAITKNYVTVSSPGMTVSTRGGYLQWNTATSGNPTLTISSSSTNITQIVINYSGTGSNRVGGNPTVSAGSYSLSTSTGTWTGDAQSVTISYTDKARISSITVTTAEAVGDGAPTFTSADGTEILSTVSKVQLATTKTGATIYYKWQSSSDPAPQVSSVSDLTTDNGWTAGAEATAPSIEAAGDYTLYAIAVGSDNSLSSISSQIFSIIVTFTIDPPTISPNGSDAWDGSEVDGIRLSSTTPGVFFQYKWGDRAETYDELSKDQTRGTSLGTVNLVGYNATRVLSVIAIKQYGDNWYGSEVRTATWTYRNLSPITLTANATSSKIDAGGSTNISASAADASGNAVSGLTYTYSIKSSTSEGATINPTTGELTAGTTNGTIVVSVTSAATDQYAAGSTEISIKVGTGTLTLTADNKTMLVGGSVVPTITATDNGTIVPGLTYTYTVNSGASYVSGINADGTLSDGKITGVAAGTATILVSFGGNDDYNPTSTLFNIVVTESTGSQDGSFTITSLTSSASGTLSGNSTTPATPAFNVVVNGTSSKAGSKTIKFNKGTTGTLTFTAPAGYAYSGITIDWDNTNKGVVSSTSPVAATDAASLSADPYNWTGNSNNVTINIEAPASNNATIKAITFNYIQVATDGTPAKPILSPVAGTVYGSQNVGITNIQAGMNYYYRVDDGTTAHTDWTASSTEWTAYDQPISIQVPDDDSGPRTVTVSVIAVNSNDNSKTTYSSATYTISLHDAPVISFDKSTGTTYEGTQSLGISTNVDDDDIYIYYHIAEPGETGVPSTADADQWTLYTSPLSISNSGTTVYAYADGDAYKTSAVSSVTLTITAAKPSPEIAWDPATKQTVRFEDRASFTAPILKNDHHVRITYYSSVPEVATIDENGQLNIVGVGTTEILASYTGSATSTYNSQSVKYTLEVTTDQPKNVVFYSHNVENVLDDNQTIPSGAVVKLDIQNYPVNYITMVSLNGKAAYPKRADRNEDNNFYYHGRGIPLYLSDADANGNVTIQVKIFDPSSSSKETAIAEYTKTLTISPYDGQPGIPTAAPATTTDQNGQKTIMTLSESSTVTGDPGNIVYAKYSNSLTYLPRVLLAEPNISIDTTKTGVFSTLISEARRTTAIQVKPNVTWTDGRVYDIASDRMTVYYEYTPNRHATRIEASPSPIRRDMKEVRGYTDESGTVAPNPDVQLSMDFYVDDQATDISTLSDKGVAYSFESSNENVATVDANGKVTIVGPGTATITISTDQVNGTARPVNAGGTRGYDAATKSISVIITDVDNARLLPPTFNPPTNSVYHVAFDAQVIANAVNEEKPKTVGDAYYILTDDLSKTYTAEEIQQNGTKINVGGSKKVNIPANPADDGKMYTIWAVTYNPENDNAEHPHYSDVASVTFTYQYISVDEPVLKPGIEGADKLYTFTDDKLTVVASVATPGASVYYTIDKPNDGVDINNGTLYDGSVKIVLSQSAIIRAVAYLDGVYSGVVTYRYRKVKTALDRPPFTVNNGSYQYDKGNGLEATMDKDASVKIYALADIDGDGIFTDDTPIDVLSATDNPQGYSIYYTTDGTEPAVATSTRYTAPLNVEQSLTIKAIAVAPDGSTSLTSTLRLNITNGISVWLADDNTCIAEPEGVDYTGQLKDQIISKDVNNANTATAPAYITITLGDTRGKDPKWGNQAVNEIFQGHRIDGYGSYDIIAKSGVATDVLDEKKVLYNHSYAQLPEGTTPTETVKSKAEHVYESTFKLPTYGTFVKFEPERDGTIYIWCLQNGGLHYSKSINNEDKFYSQFIRKRPAYLIDEQGHAVEASSITASGTFDYTNWKKIDRSKLLGIGGNQDGLSQDLFTQTEAQDIYDMYNAEIAKNNISDNTFNLTSLVAKLNDGNHRAAAGAGVDVNGDDVVDNTGYSLPSASYMKYAFPVKAGKTYFFFALKTKIGISALGFKANDNAESVSNETLTLDESATNSDNSNATKIANILSDSEAKAKTYDVTVKHSFTRGVWTSIVLPFSVSETEMKKVLGDNTDVVYFTKWDPTYHVIHMTRHYYSKLVIAGTPVFIKPDITTDQVTFTGVHLESNVSDVVDDSLKIVHMTGNYDKGTNLKQYDYYLNKSGEFSQRTKAGNISGMRGWLTGLSEQAAAKTAIGFISDEESGETTGIIKISTDDDGNITGNDLNNGYIYNMNGQLISRDPSKINALPAGVYILNGKKYVVK